MMEVVGVGVVVVALTVVAAAEGNARDMTAGEVAQTLTASIDAAAAISGQVRARPILRVPAPPTHVHLMSQTTCDALVPPTTTTAPYPHGSRVSCSSHLSLRICRKIILTKFTVLTIETMSLQHPSICSDAHNKRALTITNHPETADRVCCGAWRGGVPRVSGLRWFVRVDD